MFLKDTYYELMSQIDKLFLITLKELELIVKNLHSRNIISDPLERYIAYASIGAELHSQSLSVKYIQAQSQQSFYVCNLAVKSLKAGGWVIEKVNKKDKRIKDILPTNKCRALISAYEEAKFENYKGLLDGSKTKLTFVYQDLIDADENKLDELSEMIQKQKILNG